MKNNYKNPLIHKILLQYFVTIIGSVIVLIMVPFAIYKARLTPFFIWYKIEPIHQVLVFFHNNNIVIILVVIILIWMVISFFFIRKAVNYLNETTQATSQLLEDPEQRIQLSADLFQVQEELNQLREESNQTKRAAKEAEQRKNDLIVYLAHDLRTPLTSVIGYLTLLKEEPQLSPELRTRYTGISLEKAERLEQLISEFFEITRFNLTTLTINKEIVNLSLMVEQISYEFLPILNEKNLQWQLEIEEEITALVDAEKMERVLDNLIRNAINYSFQGSIIELSLKKSDAFVELSVSNRGYTIPPEKLDLIFEPFYRMDSSRTSHTGGTGLGLPIARDIVEAMGGKIQAESFDNKIIFSIILPQPKNRK
ncbi:vancomycin resistance histidine kinase VanS [Listeria sp. PSOL-1]|uniref:vancomycin resistance histidine kinase VanS n=1 Tax=Listeria sp. PSOL-1 TaxID=1844999 RepID=UPI0018D75E7D|nr:vancomycin resistance histidine kinase VanS [Listeria sp. PSOL-1]